MWNLSHRFDRRALRLADRHYTRQKPGTPQFVAPSSNVVLLTPAADALWVSIFQLPEFTQHAWPGAWVCSHFRNEGPALSSDLITAAVAATLFEWGPPPPLGFITFVDATKIRHKRDPGRCFKRAGWERLDATTKKAGLIVFQLRPDSMPEPASADEWMPLFQQAR